MLRKTHLPVKKIVKPRDISLEGGGIFCRLDKHVSGLLWP